MIITTGYVACQDNGDYTSPISTFPTLRAAAEWLLGFWTCGDGGLSGKYRPENYCIERWEDGAFTGIRRRVMRDGSIE